MAVLALIWVVWGMIGPSDAARSASADTTFICATTGKTFSGSLAGQTVPVLSPHSNQNTGYPAEFCYWTAEGTLKSEPTPVLLNSYVGKPGPTFCPDCRRLVLPRTAKPAEGATPPPTELEYRRNPARYENQDS